MVGGIHPKKGGETWEGNLPTGSSAQLPIFATVAKVKIVQAPMRRSSTFRLQAQQKQFWKPSRQRFL